MRTSQLVPNSAAASGKKGQHRHPFPAKTNPTIERRDIMQQSLLGKRGCVDAGLSPAVNDARPSHELDPRDPRDQHGQRALEQRNVTDIRQHRQQVQLAVTRAKLETEQRLIRKFRKCMKKREAHLRELWEEEHQEALASFEEEHSAIWKKEVEETIWYQESVKKGITESEAGARAREAEVEGYLAEEHELQREAQEQNALLQESLLTAQREVDDLRIALYDQRQLREQTVPLTPALGGGGASEVPIAASDPDAAPSNTAAETSGLECIACMMVNKAWMCSPCRHLVYCDDCVVRARAVTCPVCREPCRRFAKVYL